MSLRHRLRRIALHLLHWVRERRQRLPSPARLLAVRPDPPELRELNERGIVRLEGALEPPVLDRLRSDFETMVGRIADSGERPPAGDAGRFAEAYTDPDYQALITNDPFRHSETLVGVCLRPRFVDLIEAYLGRAAYLHQAVGLRLLPASGIKTGSFQWHHDAWGKRINLMLLLTDVGEQDQYMTYVEGSHRIRHGLAGFENSRLDPSCYGGRLASAPIFKALGRAGDAFVFDSNGLHSGNRTMGAVRDVFILHYTADHSFVWKLSIDPRALGGRTARELRPLRRVLALKDRPGLIPPYRSWVESLPHPASWI
jgi:hypothetical protein